MENEAEMIPLYPTMIYHSDMQGHNDYKNLILSKECFDEHGFTFNNDIPNQTMRTSESCSGEYRGKVLLHQDSRFEQFFKEIIAHVLVYLEGAFLVRSEFFDFYVMKSWYSIVRPDKDLSFHTHSCSDISFVYYPEMDETKYPIWFANFEGKMNDKNEIFSGLFDKNADGKQFVKEYNAFTSPFNSVIPHSGSIILFPSKVRHGVFPLTNQLAKSDRISIAGDIKVVLKENILNYESGLINIKHWKKFI